MKEALVVMLVLSGLAILLNYCRRVKANVATLFESWRDKK